MLHVTSSHLDINTAADQVALPRAPFLFSLDKITGRKASSTESWMHQIPNHGP